MKHSAASHLFSKGSKMSLKCNCKTKQNKNRILGNPNKNFELKELFKEMQVYYTK